jgi:hypothetical protein
MTSLRLIPFRPVTRPIWRRVTEMDSRFRAIPSSLAVCVLILFMPPHRAFGGPREIASRAFPSVAMVVTEDSHSQPLAIGSGFFVKERIFVSNAHVIAGAAGGYVKIVGEEQKREIKGLVAIDHKHDLALLEIVDAEAPHLEIGDFSRSAIGDKVYSVGSPKGLEGTFAEGIISAIRGVEGDKLLQHTAPISPGSSGGPILNSEGQVIGIAVATFKDGQNLNFAIPVTYLSVLVGKIAAAKPLFESKQPAEPSYLEEMGKSSPASITINSFIWTQTTLEFVVRNNLRTPVTSIRALIIFRDENDEPCDSTEVTLPPTSEDIIRVPSAEELKNGVKVQVIPASLRPGMAKPCNIKVNPATRLRAMKKTPEVRILGFDLTNGGK